MKKFIVLILVVVTVFKFAFKEAYATNSLIPSLNKLKGICVRADELSKIGIDKALKEISEYGYNAIFVLTKTPEGSVIFSSKNFPVLVEALPEIIASARKYNLKVYAYFPVMMDKTYATKFPKDLMGNLGYEKNTYYVSLLSENFINYIKLFLKELLQYDVDGIVFDYIRYPNGSYDFSDAFISLGKANGINMDYVKSIAYKTFIKPADWKTMFNLYEQGDRDIVSWVDLRERVIKDVATELRKYALNLKPTLKFGAFLVARGYRYNFIKDAPSIKMAYAYEKVNFAYFGDTFDGVLDFVIPMVYLSSLEELPDYAEVVANKIKELTKGALDIFIGVNPDKVSYSDTELEIYYSYLNSSGVVLFRHPLFTMGDITLNSPLEVGEGVSYTIKNNLSKTWTSTLTFTDTFIPPAKSEVIVNHFYKLYTLTFTVGEEAYFVNNRAYLMDVPVVLKNSRTFIPVRFLVEALGFKVSYISKTKEVVIGDSYIKLRIGSVDYEVGGKTLKMDVAPYIENSRTYVPLRFVMEALNFNINWDNENREVHVKGLVRID